MLLGINKITEYIKNKPVIKDIIKEFNVHIGDLTSLHGPNDYIDSPSAYSAINKAKIIVWFDYVGDRKTRYFYYSKNNKVCECNYSKFRKICYGE